jgi:hypothetical protein
LRKSQIEAGLLSRVHAAMDLFGLEQKQAEKYIKEVDTYEGLNGETEVLTEGSEPEVQP